MKQKTIVVAMTALLLSAFSSDNTHLEKLLSGFKKYLDETPQEKVYLHIDRPYYTGGETIWYKAYLTVGPLHEVAQSNTVYVELLDEDGQMVQQTKLLATNGSAAGYTALPDSLPSGNYMLRAYTNWMRNGDENYFFHRPIKIWQRNAVGNVPQTTENKIALGFFPEGGDYINGIFGKVGFKAIGSDGLGRELQGNIVDETGAVACSFKSNRLGMGYFFMIPQQGKNYHAVIDGQKDLIKLPLAKESGLAMSVVNTPRSNDMNVKIQCTDYESLKTIYILAQTRGVVFYAARIDLTNNTALAKIPKSKFPDGLAQITVTDAQGLPVAERLAFFKGKAQAALEIKADKKNYMARELVTLQIRARNDDGTPAASADLSLSVTDDLEALPDGNRETIDAYLLLSSELTGYIESPGYYFNPDNADRDEALECLLLTQGWRRFAFKKALETQWQKPEYNIENGLTLKGKMLDKYNGKPIANGQVTYLSVGNTLGSQTVNSNSDGYFQMENLVYYDSAQAVLQGQTKKGNKWVKFEFIDADAFPATRFPLYRLNGSRTDFEQAFISRSIERKSIDDAYKFEGKTIHLAEFSITGKKEAAAEIVKKTYKGASFSKKVDGDMESLSHPLMLIQGNAPGVEVYNEGPNWTVRIRGNSSMLLGANSTPMFMINDIPVSIEALNGFPVRNIESFDIWKGNDAVVFGLRGGSGVIAFYTKKGSNFKAEKKGIYIYNGLGYQSNLEFYSPKYDVQKPEDIKPDKRSTLLWNPHILTDSSGLATVSFYSHDNETNVTGVLEGITAAGKPVSTTFSYTNKGK